MGRGTNSGSSRGKVAVATKPGAMEAADAGAVKGAAEPGDSAPAIGPEANAKLAEICARLETSVGQVVLMMMQLPRYRHQALADINHLVIEPLLRDRVAIASARVEKGHDAVTGRAATIGAAIWASVSEEVDAKIKEQVKADGFPIRLSADEWASGDRIWLLDLVAPTRELASNVLMNFGRIVGDRPVHLHPIVARSVDATLLDKFKRAEPQRQDHRGGV